MTREIISQEDHDYFKFDISNEKGNFITFTTTFNCQTACQKINFSEKKKNMILHATITGPEVEPIHLETLINCQQTPGRAAKVVTTAQKPPFTTASILKLKAPDGYGETTRVTIKVNFDLDPNLELGRDFDKLKYVEKIGQDLNQHAKFLMNRDISTFADIMNGQINTFVNKQNTLSTNSRSSTPHTPDNNQHQERKIDKETRRIGIDIDIPRNMLHVLGPQKSHDLMNEIQREIETLANSRLENEVNKELKNNHVMANENHQLKNALAIANNRISQLSAEMHQLHLHQNYNPHIRSYGEQQHLQYQNKMQPQYNNGVGLTLYR